MNRQSPTPQAMDELIAFLPRLAADGFVPIREWGGGEKDANGAYVMPWPRYEAVVTELFEAAGQDCWMDFDYVPVEVRRDACSRTMRWCGARVSIRSRRC